MEFIDVREKLFDNAVAVADRDGYIQEVDLTVVPWNRATVADGQWLNDHAIAPLSCRDLFLADCIQSAFDGIASVEYTLSSYGMGGDGSGASGKKGLPASNVLPLNNIVDDNDNWREHYANVVPGPYDLVTPSSTMVTFNIRGTSHNIGGLPGRYFSDTNSNAILQFNGAVGAANQLLFTKAGLFARTYSVAKEAIQTDSVGTKDIHYAGTADTEFAKIPMFTGLDADITSGKLLTYDYANNTFGLADYTLPPEATAITGTTGAHLTTASNCVKLNDTDLAAGTNYFITKDGFTAYSAPVIPTGVSGIAASTSNDGKISAYGLDLPTKDGNYIVLKDGDNITWGSFDTQIDTNGLIRRKIGVNKYDLNYDTAFFSAATITNNNHELTLKLKNGNGLKKDNNDGLALDLINSSALSSVQCTAFDDADYRLDGEQAAFVPSFVAITAGNDIGKLGINPGFILYGYKTYSGYDDTAQKDKSLRAILNDLYLRIENLDTKIAELEKKLPTDP